jgi:Protein of unknown function (DUF3302)
MAIASWRFVSALEGRHASAQLRTTKASIMEALLGFHIGFWDYATFASLFLIVAVGLGVAIVILGLPGRIAIARNHPEAEAVNLMGWVGFLAVVPWMQALIWAFKPTTVIDIRYLPEEKKREIEAMIAQMSHKAKAPDDAASAEEPPVNAKAPNDAAPAGDPSDKAKAPDGAAPAGEASEKGS